MRGVSQSDPSESGLIRVMGRNSVDDGLRVLRWAKRRWKGYENYDCAKRTHLAVRRESCLTPRPLSFGQKSRSAPFTDSQLKWFPEHWTRSLTAELVKKG